MGFIKTYYKFLILRERYCNDTMGLGKKSQSMTCYFIDIFKTKNETKISSKISSRISDHRD